MQSTPPQFAVTELFPVPKPANPRAPVCSMARTSQTVSSQSRIQHLFCHRKLYWKFYHHLNSLCFKCQSIMAFPSIGQTESSLCSQCSAVSLRCRGSSVCREKGQESSPECSNVDFQTSAETVNVKILS